MNEDKKVKKQSRLLFAIAVAGAMTGFIAGELHSNYLTALSRQYVAGAALIRETDALLSAWRETYIGKTMPEGAANIILSPERSKRLQQQRETLLASFEKNLPGSEEPRILHSDRKQILVEPPGYQR